MSEHNTGKDKKKAVSKRIKNPDEWKKNKTKKARNEGKSYEARGGKVVEEKSFKIVSSCCTRKCYEKVDARCQENNYEQFWSLGDYVKQNIFLSHSLKCRKAKSTEAKEKIDSINSRSKWTYYIHSEYEFIKVCVTFLCSLLQVGKKRVQILQNKMIKHEVLYDRRGRRTGNPVKLTDEVKNLILLHCESIPHYAANELLESSPKKFFIDPQLSNVGMYEKFCEYYTSVTGNTESPIKEQTYTSFLVEHSAYSCQVSFQPIVKAVYN